MIFLFQCMKDYLCHDIAIICHIICHKALFICSTNINLGTMFKSQFNLSRRQSHEITSSTPRRRHQTDFCVKYRHFTQKNDDVRQGLNCQLYLKVKMLFWTCRILNLEI